MSSGSRHGHMHGGFPELQVRRSQFEAKALFTAEALGHLFSLWPLRVLQYWEGRSEPVEVSKNLQDNGKKLQSKVSTDMIP